MTINNLQFTINKKPPSVNCQLLKVNCYQKGQALIMVMLIGLIALTAVVSSTTLVISELRKNVETNSGIVEYQITYGALENAFLRLLRDPNYSSETVVIGSSTCYITATAGITKTVEARCTDGKYVRKIDATVSFSSDIMTVTNITEVP